MNTYLIKDAFIVNEGKIFQADTLIKDERIFKVEQNINVDEYKDINIINAKGLYLIPGMIDGQVHFREPGLTHKGDIETESKACLAGGITSYMEMPNCTPTTTTNDALEDKFTLAQKKSHVNFSFYLGATNNNLEEIKNVNVNRACGVKIFMGASTGDMLVDNEEQLEQIFKHCPILIATHCEDTPTILQNENLYKQKYGMDVPIVEHYKIRSDDACFKSSSLAVNLAKKYNSKLHVLHITTEKELKLFAENKSIDLKDKRITAEACVHHLYFNNDDYLLLGTKIKCNPAIKTEKDRKALIRALKNDVIDVIATDHAPH